MEADLPEGKFSSMAFCCLEAGILKMQACKSYGLVKCRMGQKGRLYGDQKRIGTGKGREDFRGGGRALL